MNLTIYVYREWEGGDQKKNVLKIKCTKEHIYCENH